MSLTGVLAAIDHAGLAHSTLVICTTDHGLAFPDMKCTLTDHGTGVMLIMRGPGGFSGGKIVDALVSHLDVYPTICDLLNTPHPEWLQGEPLAPLVNGNQHQIHDELFGEVTFHGTYEPQRSVRTSKWLYIQRFGQQEHPVLANVDDSPSRDLWLARNWHHHDVDPEQIYDVIFDPMQRNNLIGDPDLAPVRTELQARLQQWMRETGDPLLRGIVPLPPGASMNAIGARSAEEELVFTNEAR